MFAKEMTIILFYWNQYNLHLFEKAQFSKPSWRFSSGLTFASPRKLRGNTNHRQSNLRHAVHGMCIMKRILITGATGQIGSELVPALRDKYGAENVIAAGHAQAPTTDMVEAGPYRQLDVRNASALQTLVKEQRIDAIYHLASLLSAEAEATPQAAWDINVNGLLNVLETARLYQCAVFFPSSIGAFGPLTPREKTPQDTIQRPTTMYGVTKVSGELLCDYYHKRFGVDTRGVRYPGLISYKTAPRGGTTDYAVHIFHAALTKKQYTCFLQAGTRLDMMYMPDAIKAAITLMEAESARLIHRNGYNITAMSFAPEEIAMAIARRIPDFVMRYEIDPVRQAIAESWPRHMDDSAARQEWGGGQIII
jgi:nucleoside-diphosphate-sugar epimerase